MIPEETSLHFDKLPSEGINSNFTSHKIDFLSELNYVCTPNNLLTEYICRYIQNPVRLFFPEDKA